MFDPKTVWSTILGQKLAFLGQKHELVPFSRESKKNVFFICFILFCRTLVYPMGALDGFMYSCVSYVDGKICKSTCFPPTASQYTGTALQHHVLSSQDKSMTDMENIEVWHILVQNTVLMLQIRAYMNTKQLNFKGNLFSVFYKQKSCSATIMSQDDKMWFFLCITHKTVPRSQFFAFSNQSMIVLKNENQFNSVGVRSDLCHLHFCQNVPGWQNHKNCKNHGFWLLLRHFRVLSYSTITLWHII